MNGIPWWFFHGMPGELSGTCLRSVDPAETIAAAIPPSRVLGCVVHVACTTSAPGCSVHSTGNSLIFGDPSSETSPRLAAAVAAFRSAGFDITVSSRIQKDIWYKLWGNMTMNPISALTGATTDRMLDEPLIKSFILRVMAEAAEIGARIGCPVDQSGEERTRVTRKLGGFKTSMLQDAEAGRALEIDALLSAPREIGRIAGVETPNLDALHGLVRLYASVRGLNN
jgi:2-dehydropantoate 2-reductase